MNKNKKDKLNLVQNEYHRLCNIFIEHLWNEYKKGNKVKSQFKKEDHPEFTTELTARLVNSCINQASSVVRSRIEQIKKFYKQSVQKPETLEKLLICPLLEKKEMRIDSKNSKIFFNTEMKNFDLCIELKCLGIADNFIIPLKKHKQFNNLVERGGRLLNGIIITENYIQLCFEYVFEEKETKKTLGIDPGINVLYSTSEGYQSNLDHQNNIFKQLLEKVQKQKYNSNSHKAAIKELRDHERYMIKQISLADYSQINLETLDFTKNKYKSDSLCKFWNYSFIFDVIEQYSEYQNVSINRVDCYYTSQRCYECGYVNKLNRNGEKFYCLSCGHSTNADINAAKNIALNLYKLSRQVNQLKHFFWFPDSWTKVQECAGSLVPSVS